MVKRLVHRGRPAEVLTGVHIRGEPAGGHGLVPARAARTDCAISQPIRGGKAAYARKTMHRKLAGESARPDNLLAGHDSWVLLGEGWPTLGDACAATGLSNRS